MNYKKEDVEALAQAVLDGWSYDDCQTRYCCNYCSGYNGMDKPYKILGGYQHELSCLTLIAQDVMTAQSK